MVIISDFLDFDEEVLSVLGRMDVLELSFDLLTEAAIFTDGFFKK